MENLAQYYTQDVFSRLLVNNIKNTSPNAILDLGAGYGSLLKAAHFRWEKAELIAADIDKKSVSQLSMVLPKVRVYQANGLKINVEQSIKTNRSTIDVAVCNPPYLKIKEKTKYNKVLIDAGLHQCLQLKSLTSELVFLAQNLRFLTAGGELGIIVPDGLLTNYDFKIFREAILHNFTVNGVIELPESIFPKTDAKTHILLISKNSSSHSTIPLYLANKEGICIDQVDVNCSRLIDRMDFAYHKSSVAQAIIGRDKVDDLGFKVKRGLMTHAKLRSLGIRFLHSTSFKSGDTLELPSECILPSTNQSYVMAEAGDIIMVRVGKRCVGKIAIVSKGALPISDCLYVFKGATHTISQLWNFINSPDGKEWIKIISHGVCAKVISKNDLLNIPFRPK